MSCRRSAWMNATASSQELPLNPLSDREREILQRIAKGVSNSEAARLLSLSKAIIRTVPRWMTRVRDDPARHRRLMDLFDQATVLPLSERQALLAAVRAGQPSLADELHLLLTHDATASGLFGSHGGRLQLALAGFNTRSSEDAGPDSLIGSELAERYRVDERLGAGGMGRVYRAFDRVEQRDVARAGPSSTAQAGGLRHRPPRRRRVRAPEQAEGKPLDPRCDLYSLGCLIYVLWAGQPPFTGTPLQRLRMRFDREAPHAPASLYRVPGPSGLGGPGRGRRRQA